MFDIIELLIRIFKYKKNDTEGKKSDKHITILNEKNNTIEEYKPETNPFMVGMKIIGGIIYLAIILILLRIIFYPFIELLKGLK